MTVKLAIIYYSSYGTNHQMAAIAAEAAKAAGAEVRLLKAPELSLIHISEPTRPY